MGTLAWGACAETVILMEPAEDSDDRIVHILPRNDPEQTFKIGLMNGR